jgi:hypothetical protein
MRWLLLLFFISCNQVNDLKNTVIDSDDNSPRGQKPSCQNICPNDFNILKGRNNNRDYLAFENFGFNGIGRCRGHAIVNQMVFELSNFKNDLKYNCNTEKLTTICKNIIEQSVQEIMQYKVANFPGFNNLYELSSHPEVQEILKSYIRGTSHRFKASMANIRDHNAENQRVAIFEELAYRVRENQRPYVGVRGDDIGNHALLVYQEDFKDNRRVLCVHDSNIIFHDQEDDCFNYFYLEDGDVYYQRYEKSPTRLFIFSLTNDEDRRVARYIKARYDSCVTENKAQKRCE